MIELLLAQHLILVHNLAGRQVVINADQVASLLEPREDSLVHDAARCVIGMASGMNISVTEDCAMVRDLIEHRGQDNG